MASGGIAQLVEQLTLNQLVLGSSPSAPTRYREGRLLQLAFLLFGSLAHHPAMRAYDDKQILFSPASA